MSVLRIILISFLAAALSAVVGWFAGYVLGGLTVRGDDLGAGLIVVSLMYIFAIIFGVIGFAVAVVLLARRRPKRNLAD